MTSANTYQLADFFVFPYTIFVTLNLVFDRIHDIENRNRDKANKRRWGKEVGHKQFLFEKLICDVVGLILDLRVT